MTEFFYWIEWLFEDVLFVPMDALRHLQLDSWLAANTLNWIFLIVGICAFTYWMLQLNKFHNE